MNGIRILLYLFILIVSIINAISFYSKKKRNKQESTLKTGKLVSHRTLHKTEAKALSILYKKEIKQGEPVYFIEGEYESHSLTVNHAASDETFFIGGILVLPHKGIKDILATAHRVEVIDLENKKGALIVSVNDSITAESELKIQEAVTEGVSYSQKDLQGETFSITQGRETTKEEEYYLRSDARPLVNILIVLLLFVPVFFSQPYVSLGAFVPAIALFWFGYLPTFPKNQKKT